MDCENKEALLSVDVGLRGALIALEVIETYIALYRYVKAGVIKNEEVNGDD